MSRESHWKTANFVKGDIVKPVFHIWGRGGGHGNLFATEDSPGGFGFESLQVQEIFLFSRNVHADFSDHPGSYSVGTGVGGHRAVKFTTLYQVSRLRINGAVLLFTLVDPHGVDMDSFTVFCFPN
jgi:hypothetical protein